MMVPTVSVLMCVYNGSKFLEDSLLSILAQSFADFEFIIVNDGSTDSSVDILEHYATKDSRIKLIHQNNTGLTHALNRGLSMCRGEFVARQDADDVSLPDRLELQVAYMQNHSKVGLLGTASTLIDENGREIVKNEFPFVKGNSALQDALRVFNPFVHTSVMFRKNLMKAAGGYSPSFSTAQDYECWLRLSRLCQLENLPHPLVQRRISLNMVSKQRSASQRLNVLYAKIIHKIFCTCSPRVWLGGYKDLGRSILSFVANFAQHKDCQLSREDTKKENISVIHVTLSSGLGGGPEYVYTHLRTINNSGVTAFVAAPRQKPYWKRFHDCVGAERICEMPVRRLSVRHFWNLVCFIRNSRIQVIHSHGKGAGIYGRLAGLLTGVPCIHTFHGIHVAGMPRLRRRPYIFLEKLLGGITCTAIAVSESEREQVVKYGFCPSQKLTVIPNGVLLPEKLEQASGLHKNRYRIVHMTRFDPVKNTDQLLEIASNLLRDKRVKRFQFLVLGDGEGRADFINKVRKANLEKYFKIPGRQDEPRSLLRDALCYISASHREGMPLAVLEAMAEGVPVVATDVQGNNDAVADGLTGNLYSLTDPQEAAHYIAELYVNSERWHTYSENSFAFAQKKYSAYMMSAQLVHQYYNAVQKIC